MNNIRELKSKTGKLKWKDLKAFIEQEENADELDVEFFIDYRMNEAYEIAVGGKDNVIAITISD